MSDPVDYSLEVKPLARRWQRNVLIVLGSIFFLLAVIGIFLPLLPTTPFLLLAASCYARASTRFYNWLMNHSVFGPYIRDWRSNKGVPKKTKLLASSLIVVCFAISLVWVVRSPLVAGVMIAIATAVIVYIWRLPTRL